MPLDVVTSGTPAAGLIFSDEGDKDAEAVHSGGALAAETELAEVKEVDHFASIVQGYTENAGITFKDPKMFDALLPCAKQAIENTLVELFKVCEANGMYNKILLEDVLEPVAEEPEFNLEELDVDIFRSGSFCLKLYEFPKPVCWRPLDLGRTKTFLERAAEQKAMAPTIILTCPNGHALKEFADDIFVETTDKPMREKEFDGLDSDDSDISEGPQCPTCGRETIAPIPCWSKCRMCGWLGCSYCAICCRPDGTKVDDDDCALAVDEDETNSKVLEVNLDMQENEPFGPPSEAAPVVATRKVNPESRPARIDESRPDLRDD